MGTCGPAEAGAGTQRQAQSLKRLFALGWCELPKPAVTCPAANPRLQRSGQAQAARTPRLSRRSRGGARPARLRTAAQTARGTPAAAGGSGSAARSHRGPAPGGGSRSADGSGGTASPRPTPKRHCRRRHGPVGCGDRQRARAPATHMNPAPPVTSSRLAKPEGPAAAPGTPAPDIIRTLRHHRGSPSLPGVLSHTPPRYPPLRMGDAAPLSPRVHSETQYSCPLPSGARGWRDAPPAAWAHALGRGRPPPAEGGRKIALWGPAKRVHPLRGSRKIQFHDTWPP